MSANKTIKTIERLESRLEELDRHMDIDTDVAISQFEEHCHHLRETCHGFPNRLRELREDLGVNWHDMRTQLDELEVQLTLARMEAVEAFRERQEGIVKALRAMEDTMRRIELAEDDEGLVHYKDFVAQARKLEDKLGALDVHLKLGADHAGEALDQEKRKVKKIVGDLAKELNALEKATAKELVAIAKDMLKASAYAWDFIRAGIFQYEETEEERRRKHESDSEVPD